MMEVHRLPIGSPSAKMSIIACMFLAIITNKPITIAALSIPQNHAGLTPHSKSTHRWNNRIVENRIPESKFHESEASKTSADPITTPNHTNTNISTRRQLITTTLATAATASIPPARTPATEETLNIPNFKIVSDPQTYTALAYTPTNPTRTPPPLILFLHGAGINQRNISNLSDPNGEHAGLLPSLIASNRAPPILLRNFAVIAPYSGPERSFYSEPRTKLLRFVEWIGSDEGRRTGCPVFDPNKILLFGFSDGATVGVELATTRRFAGGVFAAYGFTGRLPDLAVRRLKGIPMWVFHSVDDVIFPVKCSDDLIEALKRGEEEDVVRYTRYEKDPEGFTGDVRGHSTGITASRLPEVYEWMLSI